MGKSARASAVSPLVPSLSVIVPAGEFPAGELLQRADVLAESGTHRLEAVLWELRLRRRRRLGVVGDLLHDPAHRLRQPVEVAIERAEARQLDQLLHQLVFAALLGA